jgi:hypothetical protein
MSRTNTPSGEYKNLINYISYLYNLEEGEKGFAHSMTLVCDFHHSKHHRALNSRSPKDYDMAKAFSHGLCFGIKIIIKYTLFGLNFNIHFQNNNDNNNMYVYRHIYIYFHSLAQFCYLEDLKKIIFSYKKIRKGKIWFSSHY